MIRGFSMLNVSWQLLPVSKSSQMITFTFENGCVATLRTSGTEPKIKYYTEHRPDPSKGWVWLYAVFCCFLWWAKGNSRIHSVSLAYSVFCAFQCASVPLGMNAHMHTYASGLLEHISAYMHICRCMYLPGFWSACAPVPHMQACMYAHTCTWTRAHTHPHTHATPTHMHMHAFTYRNVCCEHIV